MYTVVTLDSFREAFERCGREKQFSYEGQGALFNHLQELEDETGEDIELDAIALCCEYVESTIEDALAETDMGSVDELREHTDVVSIGTCLVEVEKLGRIIYRAF